MHSVCLTPYSTQAYKLENSQSETRLGIQVQHLHQHLKSSQQQEAILRTELQHRCDKVADLTKDHNALLTKFRELTILMSEAHNKLNTAVVQSGKAMAQDQSKVCSNMSQATPDCTMAC